MLFGYSLLMLVGATVALADVMIPPVYEFKTDPISTDSFEEGDISVILSTHLVDSLDEYGCGDGMMSGATKEKEKGKYQIGSVLMMVKEHKYNGDIYRLKIQEQLFNLDPSRANEAKTEIVDEMAAGCGLYDSDIDDNGETTDKKPEANKDGFFEIEPSSVQSRYHNYKHGLLLSVEDARDKCHMPSQLEHALLKPGEVFAVKLTGKSAHDDGSVDEFDIFLKNTIQKLDHPAPNSQDHMAVGDFAQLLIAIVITALVVGVLVGGISVFVKHTNWFTKYRKLEKAVEFEDSQLNDDFEIQ